MHALLDAIRDGKTYILFMEGSYTQTTEALHTRLYAQ